MWSMYITRIKNKFWIQKGVGIAIKVKKVELKINFEFKKAVGIAIKSKETSS